MYDLSSIWTRQQLLSLSLTSSRLNETELLVSCFSTDLGNNFSAQVSETWQFGKIISCMYFSPGFSLGLQFHLSQEGEEVSKSWVVLRLWEVSSMSIWISPQSHRWKMLTRNKVVNISWIKSVTLQKNEAVKCQTHLLICRLINEGCKKLGHLIAVCLAHFLQVTHQDGNVKARDNLVEKSSDGPTLASTLWLWLVSCHPAVPVSELATPPLLAVLFFKLARLHPLPGSRFPPLRLQWPRSPPPSATHLPPAIVLLHRSLRIRENFSLPEIIWCILICIFSGSWLYPIAVRLCQKNCIKLTLVTFPAGGPLLPAGADSLSMAASSSPSLEGSCSTSLAASFLRLTILKSLFCYFTKFINVPDLNTWYRWSKIHFPWMCRKRASHRFMLK